MAKCSYFSCEEEVCNLDKDSDDAMKFCEKHYYELQKLMSSLDIPGILKFWINANGGPHRMVHGEEV
jgi:hypothetical protein